MKFYRLVGTFDDKRALNFGFSPHKGPRPRPWPEGKKIAAIKHIESGVFDAEARALLSRNWATLNPNVMELPDIIGQFGSDEIFFPAVRGEIKDAIEREDVGLCDFFRIEKLYDLRHDRVICEPQYYFTAIRKKKKSIDVNLTETGIAPRADGTTIPTLRPKSRITPESAQGAMLWRDITTHEVFCTERFKTLLETIGRVGVDFHTIEAL